MMKNPPVLRRLCRASIPWRQLLAVALMIACCGSSAQQADLVLSGSNTVGAALAPVLVQAWLRSSGYTRIDRIELADQEIQLRGVNGRGDDRIVEIAAHGSGTGFRALQAGHADIGMSSRPIRRAELERLGIRDHFDAPRNEHVLGLDGIAIIVHASNSLSRITVRQLRDIFAGRITDWAQLGLSRGPIRVYARDNKSGTYDTFVSLVMGRDSITSSARRYESNERLSDDVASDEHGIGFTGLPYIRSARAVPVQNGPSRPLAAREFEIATEDYALARRLYFYLPAADVHPLAQELVAFALSDAGQRLVERTGFVAQNIMEVKPEWAGGAPPDYIDLTGEARRVSVNFRFHPGATTLDSKGMSDLDRLASYLTRPENRSRSVLLAGFADANEVSPYLSLVLSNDRADYVAKLLVQKGVRTERVRGFGAALPVADSGSAIGRGKNRRVEVWLTSDELGDDRLTSNSPL